MSSPMQVETDIRKAETIPSRVYYDPELYNHARERIFERSWQLVGDTAQLKAPGHVIPFTLLEGCLDEALVLTRSNDGIAHCLSNVCTHRVQLSSRVKVIFRRSVVAIMVVALISMGVSSSCLSLMRLRTSLRIQTIFQAYPSTNGGHSFFHRWIPCAILGSGSGQ